MTKPTRSWMTGLGLKTVATLLLSTLLISCGSSKKYDEFIPTRIVSAGDGMSYLDANASSVIFTTSGALANYANRFTVIESSGYDHWLKQFAAGYGLTTIGDRTSTSAQIIALRTISPVAGHHSDNPTDATLAAIQTQLGGFTPKADDLLVLSIGLGDILELSEAYLGNTRTFADAKAEAFLRGQGYMDYVNTLYQNGTYKRIILVNPPDISKSPYVQTSGNANLSSLVSQMTEQFTYGLKRNASTYPRDGGVWLFDATNLLLNINLATTYNVNLTTPVCDDAVATRTQVCSVKSVDIADDIADTARTTNTFSLLSLNVLPLGGTSNYSTTNYFYAGSIFPTPLIHRYMGSTLYTRMRSSIGF